MTETKIVTWRNLKIGDEIYAVRSGGTIRAPGGRVISTNLSYVTVELFGKEKKYDSENTKFEVELTEKEFHDKYKAVAADIVRALNNVIDVQEAGYHEMWNAWVDHDPYKMVSACNQNKMKIIGVVRLLIPKISFLSGETLDTGICCEYEDGERFWCHTFQTTIDYIKDKYSYLVKSTEGEINE